MPGRQGVQREIRAVEKGVVRGTLLEGDRVEAQVYPSSAANFSLKKRRPASPSSATPALEVFDFEVDTSRVLQDRSAERCVDNGGQDCLQRQHDPQAHVLHRILDLSGEPFAVFLRIDRDPDRAEAVPQLGGELVGQEVASGQVPFED